MNVIPAHRIIGRNIDMITNLLSGQSEERVIINADSKGVHYYKIIRWSNA